MDINQEKMDEFIKEMQLQWDQEENESKEFKNNRQINMMEEIYQALIKWNYLDNKDILYNEDKFSFTQKEFSMFFDLLMSYAEANNRFIEEPESRFDCQNFYLTYKDLDIVGRIAHGQGTMLQFRIDTPELWNKKYSFTWEQYIENKNIKLVEIKVLDERMTERIMLLNNVVNYLIDIVNNHQMEAEIFELQEIIKEIQAR